MEVLASPSSIGLNPFISRHVYAHTRTCIHICIYIYTPLCIYIYIHIYVFQNTYICIYIYIHTYAHACMYVCMYACMYVCMYVCMHVCIYDVCSYTIIRCRVEFPGAPHEASFNLPGSPERPWKKLCVIRPVKEPELLGSCSGSGSCEADGHRIPPGLLN